MTKGPITTVAATLAHPSYPDATWTLLPTRRGRLPVAAGRGGPFNIGWEIHGEGPIRVVFIMGLGSFKTAWQRQTLYFGHERYKEYSVLLIDNRGMGDSDRPLMRYSTSEMALDTLEVLEHVGFVEKNALAAAAEAAASASATDPAPGPRPVHIVGISMGGMIAQELACLVPNQIASLSLCCTAAVMENTSPTIWENLASRAALLIPKGVEASVQGTAGRIFAPDWLPKPDNALVPKRGTHLVGPPQRARFTPTKTLPEEAYTATETEADAPGEAHAAAETEPNAPEEDHTAAETETDDASTPWYGHFDSNYQRFVAQEMHKRNDARFTTVGFLLQLIACGWHRKSPAQLAAMADAIGRRRILVMHGTADNMISLPHGQKLMEYIQPYRQLVFEGMGHAPMVECFAWFNFTLEMLFSEGEEQSGRRRGLYAIV